MLRTVLKASKTKPFAAVRLLARELDLDFAKDFKDLCKFDPSMFKTRTSDKVKDLNLLSIYKHVPESSRPQMFADVWKMYWNANVIVKIEASEKKKKREK